MPEVDGMYVEIKVDADTSKAESRIKKLDDQKITLEVDTNKLQQVLQKLNSELTIEYNKGNDKRAQDIYSQYKSLQQLANRIGAGERISQQDITSAIQSAEIVLSGQSMTALSQQSEVELSPDTTIKVESFEDALKAFNAIQLALTKREGDPQLTAQLNQIITTLDQYLPNWADYQKNNGMLNESKATAAYKASQPKNDNKELNKQLSSVFKGLIGIRSLFALVRKIVSQNENLSASLSNFFSTIGQILAPVLNLLAAIINTVSAWFAKIFGVNAKTAKDSGITAAATRQLAGFDEINNIGSDGGGGASVVEDIKLPVIDWVTSLLDNVLLMIQGLAEVIGGVILGIWSGAVMLGQIIMETILVGIATAVSTVAGLVTGVILGLTRFLEALINGVANVWKMVVEVFHNIFDDGYQFGDIIKFVLLTLVTVAKGVIGTIWDALKALLGGFFEGFKVGFVTVWDWFVKIILEPLANGIANIWTKAVKPALNLIISGVEKLVNGFLGIVNSVISAVNKIPGVSLGRFGYVSIPRLANGGIVGSGQLFIANEAGPELIGKFGNQTGVMNNEQIVDAVSRGVYDAITSAGGQEVVLQIDGMRLAKSVVKNINALNRIQGGTVIG